MTSYQFIFAKNLLPSVRQSDFFDRDLPSTIATTNARTQRASNNLVAEADPNNGLPVLHNNTPDVLSQAHDPGIIRE